MKQPRRRLRIGLTLLAVAMCTATGVTVFVVNRQGPASSSSGAHRKPAPTAAASGASGGGGSLVGGRLFVGGSSVWAAPVVGAPVAAGSDAEVGSLVSQVSRVYGGVAAFNAWHSNSVVYTVDASVPRVDVLWTNCQHKARVPGGLLGVGGQFSAVPIPADAVPSSGSDGEMSVYSPSTDQYWELWKVSKQADGWHACWGGRIDGVSSSPGYFLNGFGASASGLASAAGMVTFRDVQAGVIDHALALAIPSPATWHEVSWPAQRSDGSSYAVGAIPEGTRLRLSPSVNVDALPLTPLAKMIARAAQTYGFIVTDKAGAVSVVGESQNGYVARGGADMWTGILGKDKSYNVLRNFPWSSLQALPTNWGKPVTTTASSKQVSH